MVLSNEISQISVRMCPVIGLSTLNPVFFAVNMFACPRLYHLCAISVGYLWLRKLIIIIMDIIQCTCLVDKQYTGM